MRELDRAVNESGLTVRCITIGDQQKADEFCGCHGVTGSCIGDEDLRTYRAIGLGDFNLSKLQTEPALLARRAENEAAGFRQDWAATKIEDAAQLPGAIVIDRQNVVRWLYRGAHPGDLPAMADMLTRAGAVLAV